MKEQVLRIRTLTERYEDRNGLEMMAEIRAISDEILEEL